MFYQQNYEYQQFLAEKLKEKKRISTIGKACGLAIIAFAFLGLIIFAVLSSFDGFEELYETNSNFETAFNSLISISSLFVPFLLAYLFLKKRNIVGELPFEKPSDMKDFILLIPIALMICLLGNILTGMFSSFFDGLFGIEFTQPDDTSDYTSTAGLLISLFATALVPAFIEEFAIRGVVLQSLRRYGDRFAIIMSSFVFALMHGNMIQIPFAFIAGMALGFIAVKTHSLWPGVLVHFLNNSMAVLFLYSSETFSENTFSVIVFATYAVIFVLGIICCRLFNKKNGNVSAYLSQGKVSCLRSNEKISSFMVNIPMVLTLAILIAETAMYINFNG